ncbi:hypothetical protein [Streptomyces sp. NPDC050263]|uniref:hypothetical protein n=1 Tax=Streptomyces sp. NPDC050263 TaxID=3155037 RepID=UPI0034381F7A
MQVESFAGIQAVRLGATLGAVLAAPVLLVAGAPLRHRYLRHVYRDGGPGLLDKERGWVSVGYFVVNNAVVRALCRPSEQLLIRWGRRL